MSLLQRLSSIIDEFSERTAIIEGDAHISYRELDELSDNVASALHAAGVRKGDYVGIAIGRSSQFIVAMLGVMKTGAVYVPLDPQSPAARNRQIAQSIPIKQMLVAGAELADFMDGAPSLDVERVLASPADMWGAPLHPADTGDDDLLYVIFTSGTTGAPNGVGVTQGNLLALFAAADRLFAFGENDIWSLFHSPAFDFSVWEIWGALLHGACVAVIPYWISRNPNGFRDLIARLGVTVLSQTPTAFRQLLMVERESALPLAHSLRYIVFGGEALNPAGLAPWFERYGDDAPKLINMFGITETTVHTTFRRLTHADMTSQVSDIGMPLPGVTVRLVDENDHEVGTDAIGEVLVAGPTVSVGYLNNPALTAERFPWLAFPGDDGPRRYYRSRDLARRLDNGMLAYIGRRDHQVKIRGFRIELGEIETAMQRLDEVKDAIVMAIRDYRGSAELTAAVIMAEGASLDRRRIRQHLSATLPPYMIPTRLVQLEEIPMTNNGKTDFVALGKQLARNEDRDAALLAQSDIENQLKTIFCEILEIEEVDGTDNFLDLGGHSLMAVDLINRIKQTLSVELDIRDLFEETFSVLVSNLHAQSLGHGQAARQPYAETGAR